jgi:PKD repeat protein
MKTLLPKLLFVAFLLCLITQSAKSACSASFTKSINELTVSFTNTSTTTSGSPNIMTYLWFFGDGTHSSLKDPVKTYSTPGTKIVTLLINDSNGCTKTAVDTFVVVADSSCAASFTRSIAGLTVNFTNTSYNSNGTTTGISYYWNFGVDGESFLKDPLIIFDSAGFKTVTLSIFDSAGICTSNYTDTFTLTTPLSSCLASFTKSISGLTVNFTNTSLSMAGTPVGLAYYWNFGADGVSYAENPTITFSSGGFKTATLSIFDSATFCTSNYIDSFTLSSSPSSCAASFTRSVSGLTITFANTSVNTSGTSAGLTYNWDFGDGTFSTLKNPVKTFTTSGVKIVTLAIYDSSASCSSFYLDSFWLAPLPSSCAASYTKTANGLTVSFTNTSLNSNGTSVGLSYYWYFGDGTSSTLKNPVKTFTTWGLKNIQLTISDTTQNCFANTSDTILLTPPAPLCRASFSLAIDTSAPFNFFILNTSIIRPASTFFWDFGDGGTSTSITPTHTFASFGTYTVCLTVTDSVCTSTYCDTIGMDSTGRLLKAGAFGFKTLDYTTQSTVLSVKTADGITQNMKVQPNPTMGELTVNFTSETITEGMIQVVDITGKILLKNAMQTTIGDNIKMVDISLLKPSIYFIHVATPNNYKVFKVIKY